MTGDLGVLGRVLDPEVVAALADLEAETGVQLGISQEGTLILNRNPNRLPMVEVLELVQANSTLAPMAPKSFSPDRT